MHELESLGGAVGNLPVPIVHPLGFAFVWQVEDVVHLFDLENFAHVFEFMQQCKENLFIEQNTHAPAFGILLDTFLRASAFNGCQINWNCVVDQHLFDCCILLHNSLDRKVLIVCLFFLLDVCAFNRLVTLLSVRFLCVVEIQFNLAFVDLGGFAPNHAPQTFLNIQISP